MGIKVLTVCHDLTQATMLTNSLTKHGWDWIGLQVPFQGFGTKLVTTYEYLKAHTEVTEFIFCDSFDVVVLSNEAEFRTTVKHMNLECDLLLGMERGLWPPSLIPFRSQYQKTHWGFDYVNSGLYYAKSDVFIKLYEKYPPFVEVDDQLWLSLVYLFEAYEEESDFFIRTDNYQSVFNNHSHIREGEYEYSDGRIKINGYCPVWVHCNGKTVDEKLNEMLK